MLTEQPPRYQCRNLSVNGRRTSIRLEPVMWEALSEICEIEDRSPAELCTVIDRRRGAFALTGAIRIFITSYFRQRARSVGGVDRHGNRGLGDPQAPAPSAPGNDRSSPLMDQALDEVGPRRN